MNTADELRALKRELVSTSMSDRPEDRAAVLKRIQRLEGSEPEKAVAKRKAAK